MVEWTDPPAARISFSDWHRNFSKIPDSLIDEYRYYRRAGKTDWNTYLQPPTSFAIYGLRYLKRLTYDNSLASLRLWGFMLNEGERIYRAKQMGKKIVAVMGDLGPNPVLVYAFPELVPFYPDCLWWAPFLNESSVLFEEAERFGLGDDCCFVRAALGAFTKRAYFPDPDLSIASTGATCDDMSAVMQLAQWQRNLNIHWLDIPLRKDEELSVLLQPDLNRHSFDFLVNSFRSLIATLEDLTGHKLDPGKFRASLQRANHLRSRLLDLKELTYSASAAPLSALEMMNAEFMTLSGYGDMEEAVSVMEHLVETVRCRRENNEAVLKDDALPVAWINPTADPLLLCWWEDLGGRVIATEYVIRQALEPLETTGKPEEILANAVMNGSLLGSSRQRARFVIDEAQKYGAIGGIISVVFASSHCALETKSIQEDVSKALNGPVLSFDLVGPGKANQQAQVRTRLEALAETLRRKVNQASGQ